MKDRFICSNPFRYLEIHTGGFASMCCPSWLPVRFNTSKLKEEWISRRAYKVRESVVYGDYSYCNEHCPHLSAIREGRLDQELGAEDPKEYLLNEPVQLKRVKFCFDDSCNLHCQTCREKLTVLSASERERVNSTLQMIEKEFGHQLERIDVSGSGEVFFSPSFRTWLQNFNPRLYPNLKNIHIHTNGTLWNEAMWNSLNRSRNYIHSAEISIDAATKETYSKIRRGGSWNNLQNNLRFISTLPLDEITCSFVVQRDNYREIEQFYEMVREIFEGSSIEKWQVMYGQVLDWGRLTREHWGDVNIFSDSEAVLQIQNSLRKLISINNNIWTNISL